MRNCGWSGTLQQHSKNCWIFEKIVWKRGVWRMNCGWSGTQQQHSTATQSKRWNWWRHNLSNLRKNTVRKIRSTAKLWLEWSQQQHRNATQTAKKRRQKKRQWERASNHLEMFLISICVWLNTAACDRLYETGGITNEGGEKTILQSNNMVALRVIYFPPRYGMVQYV